MKERVRTFQSVLANISSAFAIYSTLPEDLHGKALVMVIIGAYMAGYTFDSGLNRDVGTPTLDIEESK